MKMKRLAVSTLAASVLSMGAMVSTAQAEMEVSAEVGVASMYLWRGLDLGGGAAVSGDLSVSASGFYAGLWTSSGDAGMGTEYDVYLGYATEFGDFGIDVGYATYAYPESDVALGDVAEAIVGLSYGPASLTYFHGLADIEDYWYANLAVDVGSFTLAYGLHEDDLAHVDVTYGYNDNVSFTLSKVVDNVSDTYNDEMKFMVSASMPIKF
ncbi:MAG: TorF family putative porin [Chromatiales bacterium]|nr:TorF family putative porin [Chromatiales bacterium]